MLKVALSVSFALFVGVSTAQATTLVDFAGVTHSGLAFGSASITLAPDNLSFTGSITNKAQYAQITAFGFDLGDGSLNGYTGSPDRIFIPLTGADFSFTDADLNGGMPAGFSSVELDFAYLTGNNFAGGNVNDGLDFNETVSFMISGDFAGFSEKEIASALLVRFQEVGPNGNLSDVGSVTNTTVPEPASMLLVGGGLAYLARRRMRREAVKA